MAGRVFLRGIAAERDDLGEQRQQRLVAPRVVRPEQRGWRDEKAVGHEDASPQSRAKWMLGPGDDPFLTQTVQVHFVEIDPGGANGGHGHQNEAAFYILQGRGYEVHDGRRYEWSAGDLVVVHNDSRHQHFNASFDEPALALVMKAKALWMFLGLTQQGRLGSVPEGRESVFEERLDWTRLWTPGVERMRKVVHPADEPWQETPDGRVRWLARQGMDTRIFSLDLWLQEIAAGAGERRRWSMADEVLYVLQGSGHTLEWQVEAEIGERYVARAAREPRRIEWRQGDLVYVAQNTIRQHVAMDDVRLLGCRNRLFGLLGYDATVYLEAADPAAPAASWR